jgi:hypothetical protein
VVEQLIRNERVIGSNPISGSPLFQEDYLLKLTDLGVLADLTEASVKTHKGALEVGITATVAVAYLLWQELNHAKVQDRGSSVQV